MRLTTRARLLFILSLAVVTAIVILPLMPRADAQAAAPGREPIPGTPDVMMPEAVGSIAGVVFFDKNGNGVRDAGENGIADVLVEARDSFTAGQIYAASTTTAADGSYLFSGLGANSYQVIQTDKAGFVSIGVGVRDVVVKTSPISGIDFSDALPLALTGVIFNDLNHNGVRGLGEPPIPDALVEVYDDPNGNGAIEAGEIRLGYAFTDMQGNYAIQGIKPGKRTLHVQLPGGASATGLAPDADQRRGGRQHGGRQLSAEPDRPADRRGRLRRPERQRLTRCERAGHRRRPGAGARHRNGRQRLQRDHHHGRGRLVSVRSLECGGLPGQRDRSGRLRQHHAQQPGRDGWQRSGDRHRLRRCRAAHGHGHGLRGQEPQRRARPGRAGHPRRAGGNL